MDQSGDLGTSVTWAPQVVHETLAQSGFRRVAAFGPRVTGRLTGLAADLPGARIAYPAVEVYAALAAGRGRRGHPHRRCHYRDRGQPCGLRNRGVQHRRPGVRADRARSGAAAGDPACRRAAYAPHGMPVLLPGRSEPVGDPEHIRLIARAGHGEAVVTGQG
jgi:hypothetical protein